MINLEDYDPSACSMANGNLVGLPFNEENAQVVLLPVPWEVTVSYNAGTARAIDNIIQASYQLDLYDADIQDAWKMGIYVLPTHEETLAKSDKYRQLAEEHIHNIENNLPINTALLQEINQACEAVHQWVEHTAKAQLDQNKLVGLIGGDHSTPLGLIRAISQKYAHQSFGILHIDAHCDLRKAYEDFTYSHASIFYNALETIPNISKLVQVGIRDYCQEEVDYAHSQGNRVKIYFDQYIKEAAYNGKTFHAICQEIIEELPELVYISFDIDGLDPKLCPNTGTPVAGGFELQEMFYLIKQVVASGRKIVAFDVVEVGIQSEWDGNVAARLLYKMANLAGRSQGLI